MPGAIPPSARPGFAAFGRAGDSLIIRLGGSTHGRNVAAGVAEGGERCPGAVARGMCRFQELLVGISSRHRAPPDRYSYCRGCARVRGVPLPDAVSVRRPYRGPRHAVERQLPCAHGRGAGGLGLRVDDARERVGVSRRLAGGRPRRDGGARRGIADADRRVRRQRPSDRSVPRAGAGVSPRRGRRLARSRPAGPDSQALHAGRGEPLRRRRPRRLWQGVRAQLLRDLRPRVHEPRPLPRPGVGVQGGVPGSLHPGEAAGGDAGVPLGRRERSARSGRRADADRRRAAQYAGRMDPARRADPLQDQAQWRQPGGRFRARGPDRSHRQSRPAGARREGLEVPAGFQRGLPERGLPARVHAQGARGHARPASTASFI